MKRYKKYTILMLIITLVLTMVACSGKKNEKKIVIAEQFGLAYAPIQIMKEMHYLQELLPEYDIEWVKLGNTAAIREAVLAEKLDVGFLGIPPFLIGYDHDMPWKIFSGLSTSPLGLVSSVDRIQSLSDIGAQDRIIVPQPGSIQHILLSMAAEKEFGNASHFDDRLSTMKHPDGMQMILADSDIKLHYTSPPYLFEELNDESNHLVIDAQSCFGGDFTFIVGMTTTELYENEIAFEALNDALSKSIALMNTDKEQVLKILSKSYDYDTNVLEDYIYNRGIVYTEEVKGLQAFITFMKANGYLDSEFKAEDVLW